jgi:hypothetical protein|tara:strand:- start:540 stop:974 length:435 start_codon:yes stop_codon:yes gene_type:complete
MIAVLLLLVVVVLLCFGFYGYIYYIKELKGRLESNKGCPACPACPDCPACNVKCPVCPSYPACPDASVSKSSIAGASKENEKYERVNRVTEAPVGIRENDFDGGFNLWLKNCNDVCKICKGRGYDNCDDGVCSNCNKEYYDRLS